MERERTFNPSASGSLPSAFASSPGPGGCLWTAASKDQCPERQRERPLKPLAKAFVGSSPIWFTSLSASASTGRGRGCSGGARLAAQRQSNALRAIRRQFESAQTHATPAKEAGG